MSYNYDIRVNVDTSQLKSGERAVQDFTRSADDAGKKVKDIENNSRSAFSGLASAAGRGTAALTALAAAGAAATTALVLNAAKQADELGELARSLGVSVESLSQLQFAADFSGSSLESLSRALLRITDTQRKAADGNKLANETLRQFGITADETADTSFRKIADAFASIEDGSAKTQLAIDVFGRKLGPELIPLLSEGSAGLDRFAASADQLGVTISQKVSDDAARFNDSLDTLTKTLEGIGLRVLPVLLPVMQELTDLLSDPKTVQAAGDIAVAVGNIAVSVAAAVKELPDFIQWLDYIGGGKARLDQLEQINSEIAQLEKVSVNLQPGMSGAASAVAKFFAAIGASGSLEQVNARLDELYSKRDALLRGERVSRSGEILPSTGAEAADISNAGFATAAPRFNTATTQDALTTRAREQLEVTRLTATELERVFALQERAFDDFGINLGDANEQMIQLYQKGEIAYQNTQKENEAAQKRIELIREVPAILENINDYYSSNYRIQQAIARDAETFNQVLQQATATFGEQSQFVKNLAQEYQKLLDIQKVERVRGEFERLGLSLENVSARFTDTLIEGIQTGKFEFKRFLAEIAVDIARAALNKAVTNLIVSAFGAQAQGGAFSGPITPFARGGVVGTPTKFYAAGGVGLMGEAGPEAIMPLKRGRDGKLGVAAEVSGGGSQYVINNYVTVEGGDDPDATAQATSRAINELMDRKIRQVLAEQRRPGNSMNPTIEMY